MDDLFLKIIQGEIPSTKIYEDEHIFAFLDINPVHKGHTLVIPKEKVRNALDASPESFATLAKGAQKVAQAIQKATGADGVNIIMNNEAAAGQEVFHAHFHVIPRYANDGVFQRPTHTKYENDEERLEIARKISDELKLQPTTPSQ